MSFGFDSDNITKALLRTTFKRSLADIQRDPKRSVRNLVDLGLQFADGLYQRQILYLAQNYLSNEDSAYFRLAENIVNTIDHDKLINYGINFGYNGCTRGARIIREQEARLGCHIPFLLAFNVSSAPDALSVETIADTVSQGIKLGIYIYVIICSSEEYERLLNMAAGFSDCAFLFFVNPKRLTREIISRISEIDNIVTSVRFELENDSCLKKVRAMRDQGCIAVAHYRYSPETLNMLLSGEITEMISETGVIAGILYSMPDSDPVLQKLVYDYKMETVRSQQYPLFVFEAKSDIEIIENMFSDNECLVVFSDGGSVSYTAQQKLLEGHSLCSETLVDILREIRI